MHTLLPIYYQIKQTIKNWIISKEFCPGEKIPFLFIERIMYAAKQRPIGIFQSSYPGDLYKFIVRYRNVIRKDGSKWVHRFD